MTSALETIRYHSGIAGEEVADMVDSLEREVSSLREQVERLTEAYDQCGRTVQDYGRTIDQTESRLREVATHCANVEQELAAIAEQNEKMKYALENHAGNYKLTKADGRAIDKILELPNLATPVLNQIRAEGMRMAAEIVENTDVYTFVHGGRSYDDGGITLSAAATAIRAKADELEQSNG